jgi:hypothetical protein
MINTILTVKPDDLSRLGPKEAVDLFRELLWAEATSVGIGKDKVNVPGKIYNPDGGIDAEVKEVTGSVGQGILKPGNTHYQIKAGDFRIGQKKHIDGILFNDDHNLKSRVKACLDNHDTLVVVLFGFDDPETDEGEHLQKFISRLQEFYPQYEDPKIEIWLQNQIIGFIEQFPALALRVNHNAHGKYQTHLGWSQNWDMQTDYFPDQETKEKITALRKAISDSSSSHIRVCGEAGIGKTRFVLEATKVEQLRPFVIYANAGTFRDSDLMQLVLRDKFHCILVLDECDPDAASYIWNQLAHHSSRIRLITIYNEVPKTYSGLLYFELGALVDDEIKNILKSYDIPIDKVWSWIHECSGFPRVAHVIGWNLKNNPEDLLKPPGAVNIWERFITGNEESKSLDVQQRRRVLRFIALFKRFGYGQPLMREAKKIWEMVYEVDTQITWLRFKEIIKKLRDRKILQGEKTLYITPKMLHVYLWVEWWENYGDGFSFEDLDDFPGKLVDWHFEMFEYAAGSMASFRRVRELLGPDGPFMSNPDIFNGDRGARFFRYLAKADPEGALKCLKKTIGRWSNDQLLGFVNGRRQIVWALEEIIQYEKLFIDGAKLLLDLALAETESYTNNATGVFTSLFRITEHRPFATTEAPPDVRFQVLKETIESDDKDKRLLGLRSADVALTRISIGSPIRSPKVFGQRPKLWVPKTWGDLFDAYRQVWRYLASRIDQFDQDEQQQVGEILVKNARGLNMLSEPLGEMVIQTFKALSQKPYIGKKKLLEMVAQILHFEGKVMQKEIREQWEKLKADLTGTDFDSRLRRYLSMHLIEDHYDENGKPANQTGEKIEALANEAVDLPQRLISHLPWIIKEESQNVFRFGYQLGKRDQARVLYDPIIKAQKEGSGCTNGIFLGGYLRALFEDDSDGFSQLIHDLERDESLIGFVPSLIWRAGALSDDYASLILNLMEKGTVDYRQLRNFVYGNQVRKLSQEAINQWINYLLNMGERVAVDIAFNLFSQYYLRSDEVIQLPRELTLDLLRNPVLFEGSETSRQGDHMTPYQWSKIGKRLIDQYPQHQLELVHMVIDHFGERGTIFGGFHSYTTEVLSKAIQSDPEGVWKLIAERIEFPLSTNLYFLFHWLRGDDMFADEKKGAIELFPEKLLWRWVDNDISERSVFLASFIPPNLFHSGELVCLAREFLVRYDSEEVRSALMSNFSNEGWTGRESLHFKDKIQQLREYQSNETDRCVNDWIDEYVDVLEQREERARIREEREY